MKIYNYKKILTGLICGLSLAMSISLVLLPSRWAFLTCFVGAVLAMIFAWKSEAFSVKEVVFIGLILRVFFLPLPPILTDDVYRYLWDGRLQHEGINPYRYAPNDPKLAQYWDSELYTWMNSPTFQTAYLPVTQIGFYLSTFFKSNGLNYYLLKILFALAEFLTVLILARFLSAKALILYAWHPLILVEFAGQSHSEALMLPLLAAMIYAYRQNQPRNALIFGALSVGTKLYPIFFLPFLLNRMGWKKAGWGILVAFLMLAPYWFTQFVPNFLSSIKLYSQWFEFGAGLYTAFKEFGFYYFQADLSKQIGPFLQQFFFVSVIAMFYIDIKKRTEGEIEPSAEEDFWSFLQQCLLILSVYLLTATTVHPWYLGGILLFVSILSEKYSLSWHWIWLSAALPFTYLFYVDGTYLTWVYIAWSGWLFLQLIVENGKLIVEN